MYIITHVIFFSILILYLTAFLFYFSLHLLAYFLNFLLYLTPIIIINHPLIFICMTISNIITLYIVYLSIFDKNINLRENIIHFFNNFPLYMYVMFSSILPTTYIVTILIKLLKTRNLDFSFRLTDLKDKITILSILFLTISLYISYFYI